MTKGISNEMWLDGGKTTKNISEPAVDVLASGEGELNDVVSISCPGQFDLMTSLVQNLVQCHYAVTVVPVYSKGKARVWMRDRIDHFDILIDRCEPEEDDEEGCSVKFSDDEVGAFDKGESDE